jgi:hypothetical protein
MRSMQASSEAQVSAAGEVTEPVATANTMPSQTILCRFTFTPQSVQRKDSAMGLDPVHHGFASHYDSGPIFDDALISAAYGNAHHDEHKAATRPAAEALVGVGRFQSAAGDYRRPERRTDRLATPL